MILTREGSRVDWDESFHTHVEVTKIIKTTKVELEIFILNDSSIYILPMAAEIISDLAQEV
ncbi:hypothetical protein HYALB_00006198 [Hymenoscyphus albidus]|uniref:Uncharacterized protein n=1 Tax=Hymenoscyphus albidus TaxID=595503 RepID=A0A9N9LL52_9HELO|nr:hypothetical protein HYALB_00006198 [Hymenoscyphus albidus]